MKQQATSNSEEIQEMFFEKIASEILYGKTEFTKKDFLKFIPLASKNTANLLENHESKKIDDYDFYFSIFIVLLHNNAIAKSEKYFKNLITKLKFYNDWKDLFKREILKELEIIINKTKKNKRYKELYINFYSELNLEIEYAVEKAQPLPISLYDFIYYRENNDSKQKFFIDFILKVISKSSAYSYVKYTREEKPYTRPRDLLFPNAIREVCKKMYENKISKDNSTFFTSLFANKELEEIIFKSNITFCNYGISFYDHEIISEKIIGYKFLSKILAKFHYILFLKTSLMKEELDLSKLEIMSGIILMKEFEENEYKKLKQNVNYKKNNSLSSFSSIKSKEELINIYNKINGVFIKKVDLQLFIKHFNNEEIKINEKLTWNKSIKLLAYFINKLRDENYLSFSENLWQKTEYCFKTISSTNLKSTNLKSSYQDIKDLGNPLGYEEIDALFD